MATAVVKAPEVRGSLEAARAVSETVAVPVFLCPVVWVWAVPDERAAWGYVL